MTRQAGDPIVRREVWRGEPKVGWAGTVVADEHDLLALYMPGGSPLAFADDFFGDPHPWSHRDRWQGHGVLQLQRPGEMHAVWVFWHGPGREFRSWYVNLQEPFRRTPLGFDTQDLELDIVVEPDGRLAIQGRRTPRRLGRARALDCGGGLGDSRRRRGCWERARLRAPLVE